MEVDVFFIEIRAKVNTRKKFFVKLESIKGGITKMLVNVKPFDIGISNKWEAWNCKQICKIQNGYQNTTNA